MRAGALALIVLACALSFSAVLRKSATVDESANLPAGLALLETGAYHIDTGEPPLPRALAALPVRLFTAARLSPGPLARYKTSWECGAQFIAENPDRYPAYFVLARAVSVLVLALALFFAWDLATRWHGPAGGLLCAAASCLTPELLAHGALVTTDIHLAAALTASLWAFDGFLVRPTVGAAAALGAAVGAACLSKFTGVLLFALLPLAALAIRAARKRGWVAEGSRVALDRRSLRLGAAALGVAALVIYAGYAFQRPFVPLGRFEFSSGLFRALQAALPWLPAPFPYRFVEGFDTQLAEGGYVAYLCGRFNATGFWNYYVVGFLVKTPEPLLALALLACVLGPKLRARELPLLVVGAALFVVFSAVGHKNIGIRYLLFLWPLGACWIGRLAAGKAWRSARARWALAAAYACLAASVAFAWPDYLAFFNRASGGPDAGHEYLLDSNLDWGQDLIALREFMDREKIEMVDLAYFGRVPPELYGIPYRSQADGVLRPGWTVISANLLWGRMYFLNGGFYWPADIDTYAPFRAITPRRILGHTLYVYRITREMATPPNRG